MANTFSSRMLRTLRGWLGLADAGGIIPPQPVRAQPPAPRPLRVVRTLEGGTGRLVISGRMADVCAELERLAAMEAAAG